MQAESKQNETLNFKKIDSLHFLVLVVVAVEGEVDESFFFLGEFRILLIKKIQKILPLRMRVITMFRKKIF